MLRALPKTAISVLSLGVRRHGALLASQREEARACLEKARWTCHLCGIRIPEMMEVDHLQGHVPGSRAKLACICQFCHNLKHPLWAAMHDRIVPILAPEMSQTDLHRLAWTCLSLRDGVEGAPDLAGVLQDVKARREDFAKAFGADRAEPFFEAALDLGRMMKPEEADRVLLDLDQQVRFWPAELTDGHDKLPPAARLSAWDAHGYRVAARTAAKLLREAHPVDLEAVAREAEGAITHLSDTEEIPA